MKYYVTGANGMLGRTVLEELRAIEVESVGFTHVQCPINDRVMVEKAFSNINSDDVIINCAGMRPGAERSVMLMANAVGPKVLADFSRVNHVALVHVSTDCVFSGATGNYSVSDRPYSRDLYGRTKIEGENIFDKSDPSYLITVVRTSFIGLDHGLLRWFLDQMTLGKRVRGWTNAYWSGSTVWEVARALIRIGFYKPGGIQHLATAAPVSKYHVLMVVSQALGFDQSRIRKAKQPTINRSLIHTIELPSLENTMEELKEKVGEVWTPTTV